LATFPNAGQIPKNFILAHTGRPQYLSQLSKGKLWTHKSFKRFSFHLQVRGGDFLNLYHALKVYCFQLNKPCALGAFVGIG